MIELGAQFCSGVNGSTQLVVGASVHAPNN
jgi:hypothetical protein